MDALLFFRKMNPNELMELFKDYINIFNTIYRLHTFDEDKINNIYIEIKTKLIETKIISPSELVNILSTASEYNNRYFKSYFAIFKKLFEEYHPNDANSLRNIFNYFIYKEYGIVLGYANQNKFKKYESENYSLEIHEENTIYRAIMDDDIKSFISFTVQGGFDENEELESYFYPTKENTFLELCCYYGAVGCFKYLRDEFKFLSLIHI